MPICRVVAVRPEWHSDAGGRTLSGHDRIMRPCRRRIEDYALSSPALRRWVVPVSVARIVLSFRRPEMPENNRCRLACYSAE